MRKWGIVISVFYAVIVLAILAPAMLPLAGAGGPFSKGFFDTLGDLYALWLTWLPIFAVLSGQAILLFLSVDTSFKKLRPRAHVAVTTLVTSMLFALLAIAVIYCVGSAVKGDSFGPDSGWSVLALCIGLWVLWGIVFYLYFKNSTQVITRAISWLLKGSVLELLIAVPCHVIVRRRGDCSAPVATSFGIVTGIAVALLAFGPSVLFLVKKRLDGYATHKSA